MVMVNNLFQRFFSIHIPANEYVGLDFYLSFFFLLSNSYLFLVSSMQIAETVDFLFTAKVPLNIWIPVPSTKIYSDGPELKTHN